MKCEAHVSGLEPMIATVVSVDKAVLTYQVRLHVYTPTCFITKTCTGRSALFCFCVVILLNRGE